MNVIFATYGSFGNYVDAGLRLIEQAKSLKIFNETYLLTDSDLRLRNQKWAEWSSMLEKQDIPNRYYQAGKAFLIQHVIHDKCQAGDVIMYADVGCEIVNNLYAKAKLKKLIECASLHGGIAEQLEYPEENYTKNDLLRHFGSSIEFSKSGQIQNSYFILRCDDKTRYMVDEWVNIINPSTGLWRDPVERTSEQPYFVDHRRDQSIFSLLWKKNEFPVKKPYWKFSAEFGKWRGLIEPIHTSRNRSGFSKLPAFEHSMVAVFIGSLLSTLALSLRTLKKSYATLRRV